MPLLTAKELNNLLETAAYDKNSAIVLEENLSTQLAEKSYDYASNKALLKMYQIENDTSKIDNICSILVLSLLRLPSNDFLSLCYLLPTKVAANPRVTFILSAGELLRKAKFGEFWTIAKDAEDFSKVVGFEELAQLYVLKAASQAYKVISLEKLAAYLGVDTGAAANFVSTHTTAIDRVENGTVYFVAVEDSQIKGRPVDDSIAIEEGLGSVSSIRAIKLF